MKGLQLIFWNPAISESLFFADFYFNEASTVCSAIFF